MIYRGELEDKPSIELRDAYRRVFSSSDGTTVLADLMRRLGLFHPAANEHEGVARNVAIMIMETLGVFHETNAEALVEAFMKLPVYDPDAPEQPIETAETRRRE